MRCFVGEAMVYRAIGDVDRALEGIDPTDGARQLKTIETFAVECSINKVATSEALAYVVDEAVQVFGGNGYSREFPVERAYRDARITRIYEGTNEINRLIIPTRLLKSGTPLAAGAIDSGASGSALAAERELLANAKRLAVAALRAARRPTAMVYATSRKCSRTPRTSSSMCTRSRVQSRARRSWRKADSDRGALAADVARVYASDAADRVAHAGKQIVNALGARLAQPETLDTGLDRRCEPSRHRHGGGAPAHRRRGHRRRALSLLGSCRAWRDVHARGVVCHQPDEFLRSPDPRRGRRTDPSRVGTRRYGARRARHRLHAPLCVCRRSVRPPCRSRRSQAHSRRRRLRLEPADGRVRPRPQLLGAVRRAPRRRRRRSQLRAGVHLAHWRSLSLSASRARDRHVHAWLADWARPELSGRRHRGPALGLARGALRGGRAGPPVRACRALHPRATRGAWSRIIRSAASGGRGHPTGWCCRSRRCGGSSSRARCTTSTCMRWGRSSRRS